MSTQSNRKQSNRRLSIHHPASLQTWSPPPFLPLTAPALQLGWAELIVGVVKTHQLTYSPTQTLYALSNRNECTQQFIIQSRLAKEYLEHFQSRIEEVDIYVDGDKLIFNGFTEGFTGDDSRIHPNPPSLVTAFLKTLVDEELLKQPLQTQVSLSTGELDDFRFQERTHILLPLRDLKVLPIQPLCINQKKGSDISWG